MANLTWKILDVKYNDSVTEPAHVIQHIMWRIEAVEGECVYYITGEDSIPYDSEAAFIPLESVTEEQVLGWLKGHMGQEWVDTREAQAQEAFTAHYNPSAPPPKPSWLA